MSLELKTFLFNSYGALVNRHLKDGGRDEFFKIDDSKHTNEGSMFCHMYVGVIGLDRLVLHLTNLPMNHEIEELVRSRGGEISKQYGGCHVSLTLESTDTRFVARLSELIRDIVAPGRMYTDPNYGSTCRRTADSLSRFAALLRQYEKQTRGMEKTRPDGLFAF